ncbi:MAG: PEP-CTERM sorting domain-containing protein [Acidobacteriia bacterium]|nr:PEP-CTERM sorting domain-containing protein [Terriglobia bacterium]
MKRIPILLSVLLALAAFSSADTINLTSGSGKLYPFEVAPGFTFHFYGGGYGIAIPAALDDPAGSLWDCHPCDPTHFDSPLFFAAGDFTLDKQFVSGMIGFNAVSFVSSLAPNGVLTIKFTATPDLYLLLGISHQTGPFVWGNPNQHWYITAQFTPFSGSGLSGFYTFAGATFSSSSSPIPEPATIVLFGTGVLPILFGVRRRFSRTNPRIKGSMDGSLPNPDA